MYLGAIPRFVVPQTGTPGTEERRSEDQGEMPNDYEDNDTAVGGVKTCAVCVQKAQPTQQQLARAQHRVAARRHRPGQKQASAVSASTT